MAWLDDLRQDDIVRYVRKVGRDELAEIAAEMLGGPPKGASSWDSLNATKIAGELVDRLPAGDLEPIAAKGLKKQRQPSIGGPSWLYDGPGKLAEETIADAVVKLRARLKERWQDVDVIVTGPGELLEGRVDIEYTARTPQAVGEQVILADADCVAIILLDYTDQVSTVSARSDEDAALIGVEWAHALSCTTLSPIQLNFKPSLGDDDLSESALQMLEAVYGRLASVGQVVNIDHIWTRRQDPDSQVQEQTARGEDRHVLADADVKNCLKRGDLIAGLAFQLDFQYRSRRGRERHFVPHVTLRSEDGALILKVTRPGQNFERASHVYQMLRRSLARRTHKDALTVIKKIVADIK